VRGDRTDSFFFRTSQTDNVESGNPFRDLTSPIVESTLRHDDEMRTVDSSVEFEVTEERDRLKSFSETLQKIGESVRVS
jgi:translation elongation factor EF-Ts